MATELLSAVMFSCATKSDAFYCNRFFNRCAHSCQRKQSIYLSEPNKSQESIFPPSLGPILPAADGFLEGVRGAALAHENERLLGRPVQLPLKPQVRLVLSMRGSSRFPSSFAKHCADTPTPTFPLSRPRSFTYSVNHLFIPKDGPLTWHPLLWLTDSQPCSI